MLTSITVYACYTVKQTPKFFKWGSARPVRRSKIRLCMYQSLNHRLTFDWTYNHMLRSVIICSISSDIWIIDWLIIVFIVSEQFFIILIWTLQRILSNHRALFKSFSPLIALRSLLHLMFLRRATEIDRI